ncbi:hypothetical protein BpHYR1_002813, partial [Brachionus plicatilis]
FLLTRRQVRAIIYQGLPKLPNTQRKNQRIRDQRIKRIVEKYNDSDHIQYLNSIGNYFDFIHN